MLSLISLSVVAANAMDMLVDVFPTSESLPSKDKILIDKICAMDPSFDLDVYTYSRNFRFN